MSTDKNRDREPYSFANINMLGKCNVDCFFCLGKDLKTELAPHNQLRLPFSALPNLPKFLDRCKEEKIPRIYITGQNTDSLLYKDLDTLITYLQRRGFLVGLRTNGYLALDKMDIINRCDLSIGYSIHSLDPMTNNMIMGRGDLPDWSKIIKGTRCPRVSIVLNRCNEHEFFDILRYTRRFKNIRYIQVRRVSSDRRCNLIAPDVAAYERVYTQVSQVFAPMKKKLWADAEVYEIYGQDVVFWRTTKTSVNSLNYFSDGTISDLYFVVEGYLKHRVKEE